MWSWLEKYSPCKAENVGGLYDRFYALYEFANRGTNGCPCCTFYRGFAYGIAVMYIITRFI
ncbi:MAG: hypothetical protein BWK73_20180 [Thiothrix lacustris]|uniref:Uncharacterized protein n=1 Tax=Thiothrix lacustris TaxID=525917 RepID=A0A1Y1QPE8_9GAMM|nr:MAG: hypothetical protein BWK73_20180 [Thiothrix lacustris]